MQFYYLKHKAILFKLEVGRYVHKRQFPKFRISKHFPVIRPLAPFLFVLASKAWLIYQLIAPNNVNAAHTQIVRRQSILFQNCFLTVAMNYVISSHVTGQPNASDYSRLLVPANNSFLCQIAQLWYLPAFQRSSNIKCATLQKAQEALGWREENVCSGSSASETSGDFFLCGI